MQEFFQLLLVAMMYLLSCKSRQLCILYIHKYKNLKLKNYASATNQWISFFYHLFITHSYCKRTDCSKLLTFVGAHGPI